MEPGFRVGDWQVQPDPGTLTRGEKQVQLEPKVMEVLVYLARHPGDVLPKEKIIRAVWPDTFVTDEVLTNAISELRKAFGDDAKNPTIIQTLPRRGYWLIAPVTGVGRSQKPENTARTATRTSWRNPVVLAMAGAVLVIIAGLLIWQVVPADPPAKGPIDSIAILPFMNETGDPDADYLCSEIPASLSAKLSELRELRVIPTSNLTRFWKVDVDAPKAAKELGVRAVLQGRILQIGDQLSVGVELSDGVENRVLWGEKYLRPFRDVLGIEEEIVRKAAASLRLGLRNSEANRLARHPTENDEAYEYYQKGNFLLDQFIPGRGQQGILEDARQAVEYFRLAIRSDPAFALAYVGLSNAWGTIASITSSTEYYLESRRSAHRALLIGDRLPAVHKRWAWILAFHDHDWRGAETEYQRCLELGADPELSGSYIFLLWMGRDEEALQLFEVLVQRSDPLSRGWGGGYYWNRQFDKGLERSSRDGGGWMRALFYQALRRENEAFQVFMSLPSHRNEAEETLKEYQETFETFGLKGVWRIWSDKAVARKDKPYDIAASYAYAGENDLAFKWLEKAYELPTWFPFVTDARFDSLRDDPRYEQLLRKLNLPEDAIARHLKADY